MTIWLSVHAYRIGLSHEVRVSSFEENLDKASFPTPADYAKTNALSKAAAVVADIAAELGGSGECGSGDRPPVDLVIGSDTVVVVDGRILEKPRSEAAAFEMLSTLRYVLCWEDARAPTSTDGFWSAAPCWV